MSLEAGARLGPYEIVAPLGAGGMGEVWRARDPRIGREVARRCAGLDMKVIGYDPFIPPAAAGQQGIEVVADLASLLPKGRA